MGLTRRELLKLGLFTGISGMTGCFLKRPDGALQAFSAPGVGGSTLVPFQTPLPVPPVLNPVFSSPTEDYYEITMQPTSLQILPPGSPKTLFWTYNGIVPGPTIVANQGKETHIKHINMLGTVQHRDGTQVDTTIHLHGAHVPAIDDGHPNDLIQPVGKIKPVLPIKYQLYPNGEKVYHYPNNQEHATLWYTTTMRTGTPVKTSTWVWPGFTSCTMHTN